MATESKIQWTQASWNPWHGCRKVSAGCKFCYMFRDKERYGQEPTTVLRSKSTFNQPLKMNEPSLIFTCSWSDWFIEEADQWRDEAWKIIKETPQHTYQILTKRPENILDRLPADWKEGYRNVWLGFSAEDQPNFDARWSIFKSVKAYRRFVSIEPLIGAISIKEHLPKMTLCGQRGALTENDKNILFEIVREFFLDWAIIGGESGNNTGKYIYRPCELEWMSNLVSEFQSCRIPVFVKQMGTFLAKRMNLKDSHGGDINEFPDNLKVREFPKL